MLIFTKIADLEGFLKTLRSKGQTIGFVPTMGALHKGHISLIEASKASCNATVCSIFVNPTQFNDSADLDRYPRMPAADTQLLQQANCDALFLPSVNEIYPTTEKQVFDFGELDKILEGKYRPGHFNGVAQVVKRFFEIVKPNKAFFGSKDFQQVLIVKALVAQMRSDIEIVPCPILRESDGLAMSSRNTLLSAEERVLSGLIPRLMARANELAQSSGFVAAKEYISDEINKQPLMKLDYFEFCDSANLNTITQFIPNEKAVALIAVFVGKIRLIDNLILN